MPHSSGGGSSSSGGHSGSSSSSHSSSSSGSSRSRSGGSGYSSYESEHTKTRSTYFKGARRFVLYRRKRPVFVFSNSNLISERETRKTIGNVLFYAVIVFFIVGDAMILKQTGDLEFTLYGSLIFTVFIAIVYLFTRLATIGIPDGLTEVKDAKNEPDYALCPNCNNYFVDGAHQECPHCGYPIASGQSLTVISSKEFEEKMKQGQVDPKLVKQGFSISERYFDGATQFAYYKNKRPYFLYADTDLRNEKTGSSMKTRIIKWAVAAVLIVIALISSQDLYTHTIEPIQTDLTYKSIIDDRIDVLSDEQEKQLQKTLDEFLETTGVPVAFYTDYNGTWRSDYTNLIDYSYDLYVDNFEDEYHWAIVYTQAEDDSTNWYWEGMQGNYTDRVLNVFLNDFNEQTQNELMQGKSPFEVFNSSFASATDTFANQTSTLSKTKVQSVIAVLSAAALLIVWSFKADPYKNKDLIILDGKERPQTESCPYCGNEIISGIHQHCPHCKQELKTHSLEK